MTNMSSGPDKESSDNLDQPASLNVTPAPLASGAASTEEPNAMAQISMRTATTDQMTDVREQSRTFLELTSKMDPANLPLKQLELEQAVDGLCKLDKIRDQTIPAWIGGLTHPEEAVRRRSFIALNYSCEGEARNHTTSLVDLYQNGPRSYYVERIPDLLLRSKVEGAEAMEICKTHIARQREALFALSKAERKKLSCEWGLGKDIMETSKASLNTPEVWAEMAPLVAELVKHITTSRSRGLMNILSSMGESGFKFSGNIAKHLSSRDKGIRSSAREALKDLNVKGIQRGWYAASATLRSIPRYAGAALHAGREILSALDEWGDDIGDSVIRSAQERPLEETAARTGRMFLFGPVGVAYNAFLDRVRPKK